MRWSIPSPVTLAWSRGTCSGGTDVLPTTAVGVIRADRE